MQQRRHERPLKRTNPSGRTVWIARYTGQDGKRRSAGTFELRGACKTPREDGLCCAQHAIDAAYGKSAAVKPERVREYWETWSERHPRSDRTNKTNDGRIRQVIEVPVNGIPLGSWRFTDLRRRHALELVDHMLRKQGRAATGAVGVLRALSAMTEDAITDEVAELNPFKGVKVRKADPRVVKAPKPVRVWSWEEMHGFAAAAGRVRTDKDDGKPHPPVLLDAWRPVYAEAMIRVLSDCGLRLGELLPLYRQDVKGAGKCDVRGCVTTVPHLHVQRTAYLGVIEDGTKEQRLRESARQEWPYPGRVVPLSPRLEGLLGRLPARIDTRLVFPAPKGSLWRERNFYRDVWETTRATVKGMEDCRPHEFRHSWTSLLRGAGVDPADLADMAGHTVETATSVYTHALGRSHDAVRNAVGS